MTFDRILPWTPKNRKSLIESTKSRLRRHDNIIIQATHWLSIVLTIDQQYMVHIIQCSQKWIWSFSSAKKQNRNQIVCKILLPRESTNISYYLLSLILLYTNIYYNQCYYIITCINRRGSVNIFPTQDLCG